MFTVLADAAAQVSLNGGAAMSVPVSWVLASGAAMAGSITTLAGLIYKSQQKQIDILREEIAALRVISSDRSSTIKSLNIANAKLQDDVQDLKRGCGAPDCVWKNRA